MSVVSGVMGANAQKKSAGQAQSAQNEATAAQERMYQQQRTDFQPFLDMGTGASPYLQSLIYNKPVGGVDAGSLISGPTYTDTTQQRAYNNAMASRGLLGGGRGAWGQAEVEAQGAERRKNMTYNQLMDLIKIGQGTSGQVGQAGQNLSGAYGQQGSALGNIFQQEGMNKAALYSGTSANAIGGAKTAMELYKMYQGA